MKIICLMLCLNLVSINANAQRNNQKTIYRITFIKGEIILQKTNKQLAIRDIVTSDDKIQFRTAGAKLGAVSVNGQRYMAEKPLPKPEYYDVWETFMHGKKAAADRGSVGFPTLNSLQKFFAASKIKREDDKGYEVAPFALLEEVSYKVTLKGLEQNEKQYFFLQFTDESGQSIKRPLSYEDKYLLIKREDCEGLEDKTIEVFFQKENGEQLFISQMMPVLINPASLKEELNTLIKYLGDKHPSNKVTFVEEILPHVEEFYGKIDEQVLTEWLKNNLKFDVEK